MRSYPVVFISYSWDSPEHQTWVREVLANGLRRRAVDARIDQHTLRYGDRTDAFMESIIPDADHIVVVCTPNYYARAAADEGGVGYEKQLIKQYMMAHGETRRVVPVLRSGDRASAIPPFLGSRLIVDLRVDEYAELLLDELAAVLTDQPLHQAPPVQPAAGGNVFSPAARVEHDENSRSEPVQPPPGTAAGSDINIHAPVDGEVNQGSPSVEAGSARNPARSEAYRIQILGGILATVVGGLILAAILGNTEGRGQSPSTIEPASPTPAGEARAGFVLCGKSECALLRVSDTVKDGLDEGVFVRSGPGRKDSRLTGAALGDRIFGLCQVDDGMEIVDPGLDARSRRWVKSPFRFVPGDLGPGDTFSDPKSHSDPESTKYGWISAVYLSPDDVIRRLPRCQS